MSRLALVAMLLLVALPTLGRLGGRSTMPMPAMHAGSMPSMSASSASSASMPMMAPAVAAASRSTPSTAPTHCHDDASAAPTASRPAPRHPQGDADCDYCPLLAALALPAAVAPPLPVAMPPRHVAAAAIVAALLARHPAGLGSRGPPAAA